MNYLLLILMTVKCLAITNPLQYDEDDAGTSLKRTKRASRKVSFSFEEKVAITKRHNELRRLPKSSNMQKMVWDTTLEGVAKNWSRQCRWQHNPKRKYQQDVYGTVGENIFYTTGVVNGKTNKFLSWWYSEIVDYTYSNNTCMKWRVCGHYTQIVWHSTIAVGCALNFCPKAVGIKSGNIYFVVCNYGPAGNWRGAKPYTEGEPCKACPAKRPYCDEGLCSDQDCGGKKCLNGGKLVSDVCMCDCSGTNSDGDTCQIVKTNVNGTTNETPNNKTNVFLANTCLIIAMTIVYVLMYSDIL